jgi:hypothetical protein
MQRPGRRSGGWSRSRARATGVVATGAGVGDRDGTQTFSQSHPAPFSPSPLSHSLHVPRTADRDRFWIRQIDLDGKTKKNRGLRERRCSCVRVCECVSIPCRSSKTSPLTRRAINHAVGLARGVVDDSGEADVAGDAPFQRPDWQGEDESR